MPQRSVTEVRDIDNIMQILGFLFNLHSRPFTLKCMTRKCIARVARAKTPSADTALPAASMETEVPCIIPMRKHLHSYHPCPIHTTLVPRDPFLNSHPNLLLGHPLHLLLLPLHPLPTPSAT